MKIIAGRGTEKTIFLHSLINREIVKHEDIFCPTFDNPDQWRSSGFNLFK